MSPQASDLASLLLQNTHAGSRTLLLYPPEEQPCLDLAARGYRLTLVTDTREALDHLRAQLRQAGLASQLMGGMVSVRPESLSLAHAFYEIAVLFRVEPGQLQTLEQALERPAWMLVSNRPAPFHLPDTWIDQDKTSGPWRLFRLPEALTGKDS